MRAILAFDTSGAHCAAAIYWPDGARPAMTQCENMAKGQAECLLPMLEAMLAQANVTWTDIAAIGVGIGPGNFTGIRISVALARGLALGLGIPAIGVAGFDACAQEIDLQDFYVTIPAPRGQIYVQGYGAQAGAASLLDTAPTDLPARDITDMGGAQLALSIAVVASQRLGSGAPRPAPFYLRPADAAPPSDPPPTILP